MRQRAPMLDLNLFKNGTFAGANTVMLLVGLAMFGVFFYNSLFIQNVLGFSAVQTGASFLPMTVLIILVAPIAGKYSDRVGSRWLDRRRDDPALALASHLLAARRDLELLGHPARAPHRRLRHGDRDDADDGRRDGLRPGRQGGRRLGGPEQHAPGRRLARHRRYGRDRRRLRDAACREPPAAAEGFVTGYQHALQVAAAIALAGAVLSVATVRKYRHVPEPVLEGA